MHETAFSPANILLPQDCGLTKWAVVACDQYTSCLLYTSPSPRDRG